MASSNSLTLLRDALARIRDIERTIAAYHLTKTVFADAEHSEAGLNVARDSVGLGYITVVQNIRALKKDNPIVIAHPHLRYNISDAISRRNWLTYEYKTTTPIRWGDIAKSVYDDMPIVKSAIIAALQASGDPSA